MSFVENLERDDWAVFMRRTFAYTLEVLRSDRFRTLGSSADDLRGWLTAGGVPRARRALDEQMCERQLDARRITEVLTLLSELAIEFQAQLLELFDLGVIPTPGTTHPSEVALSPEFIQALLRRMQAGDRPFEQVMRAMGRSEEDIAQVYASIDQHLLKQGLIVPAAPGDSDDVH